MAKKKLPEPTWREQLTAWGFTDEDIDEVNVVPLHRFLIKMNLTFSKVLKHDIALMVRDVVIAQNAMLHRMNKKLDTKFKSVMTAHQRNERALKSLNSTTTEIKKYQKTQDERLFKLEAKVNSLENKVNSLIKEHIHNHKKLVI